MTSRKGRPPSMSPTLRSKSSRFSSAATSAAKMRRPSSESLLTMRMRGQRMPNLSQSIVPYISAATFMGALTQTARRPPSSTKSTPSLPASLRCTPTQEAQSRASSSATGCTSPWGKLYT